jgi:hypothetical protein
MLHDCIIGRGFINLSEVMLKIGAEARVYQLGQIKFVCELSCRYSRNNNELDLPFGDS